MKKSQLREFAEPGIIACVLPYEGEEYLELNERGVLLMPAGVEPKGFHLLVAVREDGRTFVVQKDVGHEGGDYSSGALSELSGFVKGFRATIMRDPIEVIRHGQNTWTGWHKNQASNRVDCWHIDLYGALDLFQVGIVTHDNGATYVLHGEYRWRGQLCECVEGSTMVGLPRHKKWGSLEGGSSNRTQIFGHPEFKALMKYVDVLPKCGSGLIDPPLPKVPGSGLGVVDWFVFFAGQTGQGIVKSQDGWPAWVHGIDVEGFDPASSEPPLWRGDIISFEEAVKNWGAKKNGPPKLTGVKLVKRDW